jgi:hypothetical protein
MKRRFADSSLVSATITFQHKLRNNADPLTFATAMNYVLDNSITYVKENLFVSWAKWSRNVGTAQIMEMFSMLLATGATHGKEDIFDLLTDVDCKLLTFPVVFCLLSRPSIFPMKRFATGPSLPHIIHSMNEQKGDKLALELEIRRLMIELSKSQLCDFHFSSHSIHWDSFDDECHHPISTLPCAIESNSVTLVALLFDLCPHVDLDQFFQTKDEKFSHWQCAEDWAKKFRVSEEMKLLIKHKRRDEEVYLNEVFECIENRMYCNLADIVKTYLNFPLYDDRSLNLSMKAS